MSRLFLSHSSSDNARALALGDWLRSRGWTDFFLDVDATRGIAAGERWLTAFMNAVGRCEAVIFLLSPAWCESRYCIAELAQAKAHGKRIFGVLIEPIEWARLPVEITAEWQVCNLVDTADAVVFTVSRPPIVAPVQVAFPAAGLEALARGLRQAGLDPLSFVWPPPDDPQRSPYRGLSALQEADAGVFFGRDGAIVRAIDKIRLVRERGVETLFVVQGASGAGKSSFLRAGLLPRLRNDAEHFVVMPVVRPERAALSGAYGLVASLKAALSRYSLPASNADLRDALATGGLAAALQPLVRASARAAAKPPTIVLPLDQAEELLDADGQAEAQAFLKLLGALPAAGIGIPLLVVCTIRSDAWPAFQAAPSLQNVATELFSLPPMPQAEYKAVVEGPARRHTEAVQPVSIDADLADQLVQDSVGADALPLLALTLEWLYREFGRADSVHLSLAEYRRLGGVRGVIGVAVQRAFDAPARPPAITADVAERRRLLGVGFAHLATVDPDTGKARRRLAARRDLRARGAPVDALVQRLIDQRLLRSDLHEAGHVAGAVEVVELAHEALLRQWDVLDEWLNDHADRLRSIETVRRCAHDWQVQDRDAALLLHRGERLRTAEALQGDAALGDRSTPLERAYLAACRTLADQEREAKDQQRRSVADAQRRTAVAQRRFARGLSVAALLLTALTAFLVVQYREVARGASLALAEAADRALDAGRVDRALRLGVLAARSSWLRPSHPVAAVVLARAADRSRLQLILAGRGGAGVGPAAFSPDGRRIVTGADGSVQIWDAATGTEIGAAVPCPGSVTRVGFAEGGARVVALSERSVRTWDSSLRQTLISEVRLDDKTDKISAASADGRRIVKISQDGSLQLLDVDIDGGKPSPIPLPHPLPREGSTRVVFSADGKRFMAHVTTGTTVVWDVRSGTVVGEALRYDGDERSSAFAADGRTVVIATSEGVARVWDVESGRPLGSPMRHPVTPTSAEFSPDGTLVVTADDEGTVRLWDAETGAPAGDPMQPGSRLTGVYFSPDGRRLATATLDGSLRLWNGANGKPLGEPLRRDDGIWGVAFSPDSKRIAASGNGAVWVWDAGDHKALAMTMHEGKEVYSAALTPDGRGIATAANDGIVRLWRYDAPFATLSEMIRDVPGLDWVALGPDARRLVTASADGNAQAWNERLEPQGAPMHHARGVLMAAYSKDGGRIVTASLDGTARVWDASSGKPLGPAMGHGDAVHSAAFSADGERVVTASADGSARLWRAETATPDGPPLRHPAAVQSAVFSPDGRRVLTACADGIARVWDAATGGLVSATARHASGASSAVFGPDGRRVATAWLDGTARISDAATGAALGPLMRHAGPIRSVAFSADGKQIVTASSDGTAQIWDAANGKPAYDPMPHDGGFTSTTFSPDGQRVLTTSYDGTARLWNSSDGEPAGPAMRAAETLGSGEFSADGRRIVTISESGMVQVWDARSGQPVGKPLPQRGVDVAKFSPDGLRLFVSPGGGPALIWDIAGHHAAVDAIPHGEKLRDAAFSRDGKRIVIASDDGNASILDAVSGRLIGNALRHAKPVDSVAFSADGKRVLTLAEDFTARLWDAGSGYLLTEFTAGDHPQVAHAELSSNGRRVLTAANDGSVQVWHADTGKADGRMMKQNSQSFFAAFSPDGQRVVASSWGGTAQVWDPESGRPLGDAMPHDSALRSSIFSLDGRRVLTFTTNGGFHARVWDAGWEALAFAPDELLARVCKEKTRGTIARIGETDIAATVFLSPSRVGESVCPALVRSDDR